MFANTRLIQFVFVTLLATIFTCGCAVNTEHRYEPFEDEEYEPLRAPAGEGEDDRPRQDSRFPLRASDSLGEELQRSWRQP